MKPVSVLRACLFLAMGCLVLRLVHLQVIHGADYRELADHNRLRVVPDQAPRGVIVDRHGRLLASNYTQFQVAIIPQEVDHLQEVLTHVSHIVHRPVEALQRELVKETSLSFVPASIVPMVPKETALQLEEDRWRFPGLLIRSALTRAYPLETRAAHLLGYLSQPTAEELSVLKEYGVRPKELVGRMGIERLLDQSLRGRSGGLVIEVNHRGRQIRVVGRRDPEPGERVTLTIDAELQAVIEETFGARAGACVVLDPMTGEVLALVSSPTFSPNSFANKDQLAIQRLLDDPEAPLMNRATVGAYPPGSIMKLATAAAALEQHVITPMTTITCRGALTIGDRTFHCWNRDGHGPLTLPEALMHSCNVYFMEVGRRVGATQLRASAEHIGFSRRTGWVLEERPGYLPQHHLTEGEVALMAIGQGEVLVTPLQAAVLASIFANGGWVVTPSVIQAVGDRPFPLPHGRSLGWSPQTIETIRAGMEAVVNRPDGTGHRAASPLIRISGKTGTAQTHVPGKTHGWFIGFCPTEHPRVAMAIVAEYGGSGGDLPSTVAKAVCEFVAKEDRL